MGLVLLSRDRPRALSQTRQLSRLSIGFDIHCGFISEH